MCWGTEREDDHHHRFVVAAPVILMESALRIPSHRDCRWPRLSPIPLGARVELLSGITNRFLCRIIAIEIRLAKERAGKEPRSVDCGQLDLLVARGRVHIE